jgi:glycosyltransferase involved in cell wall biosynthesis
MSGSHPNGNWSIMIPVRNRTTFLANALASLLDQDLPASTQIEIVDSSNIPADLRSIVAQFSQLQIDYYIQPHDFSIAENWNTCVERARNELVHILHDDDWSFPDFTQLTALER